MRIAFVDLRKVAMRTADDLMIIDSFDDPEE
jgi:hypothetical protein